MPGLSFGPQVGTLHNFGLTITNVYILEHLPYPRIPRRVTRDLRQVADNSKENQ
jgi:hypothetical protein